MTDQSSLFALLDPPSSVVMVPTAEPLPTLGDVIRCFEHKAGPFVEVVEGKQTGRKFQIVQVQGGAWWAQFLDNRERKPIPCGYTSDWYVGDALHFGVWREIGK